MDFLNKKVIHKLWGEGTVCEHQHPRFKVRFGEEIKSFSFPQSFAGFLRFADSDDQNALEELLKEKEELDARSRESVARTFLAESAQRRPASGKSNVKKPNIAFKCNYCDGGSSKQHIGYMGACSDKMIHYNINVARHSWCSDPNCPCRQYWDGEIDGSDLDRICYDGGFTCYESKMLIEWTAFAGTVLQGENKERPKKIKNVQVDSLAVLTTREPYAPEEARFIFGVFLVDAAGEGNDLEEGYVRSDSKYRIELAPEEAAQIRFWNYHSNENNPEKPSWSQGLYRYFNDIEAVQMLRDIVEVKRSPAEKKFAEEFLQHFCKVKGINLSYIPKPNGALKQ